MSVNPGSPVGASDSTEGMSRSQMFDKRKREGLLRKQEGPHWNACVVCYLNQANGSRRKLCYPCWLLVDPEVAFPTHKTRHKNPDQLEYQHLLYDRMQQEENSINAGESSIDKKIAQWKDHSNSAKNFTPLHRVGSRVSVGRKQAGGSTSAGGQWECPTCTLMNESDLKTCIACDSPQPNTFDAPMVAEEDTSESAWVCQQCSTGDMDPQGKRCNSCGAWRSWCCPQCTLSNLCSNQFCVACDTEWDPSYKAQQPLVEASFLNGLSEGEKAMLQSEMDSQRHRNEGLAVGRKRLDQRLIELGCDEQVMVDDGNCQFRSLSFQLWRSQQYHSHVRAIVVSYMKKNKDEYSMYFTSDKEFADYIKRMACTTEWGDELTLRAASDAMGISVHVATSEAGRWILSYSPMNELSQRTFDINDGKTDETHVFLSYQAPVHYNSIIPEEDTNNKYLFIRDNVDCMLVDSRLNCDELTRLEEQVGKEATMHTSFAKSLEGSLSKIEDLIEEIRLHSETDAEEFTKQLDHLKAGGRPLSRRSSLQSSYTPRRSSMPMLETIEGPQPDLKVHASSSSIPTEKEGRSSPPSSSSPSPSSPRLLEPESPRSILKSSLRTSAFDIGEPSDSKSSLRRRPDLLMAEDLIVTPTPEGAKSPISCMKSSSNKKLSVTVSAVVASNRLHNFIPGLAKLRNEREASQEATQVPAEDDGKPVQHTLSEAAKVLEKVASQSSPPEPQIQVDPPEDDDRSNDGLLDADEPVWTRKGSVLEFAKRLDAVEEKSPMSFSQSRMNFSASNGSLSTSMKRQRVEVRSPESETKAFEREKELERVAKENEEKEREKEKELERRREREAKEKAENEKIQKQKKLAEEKLKKEKEDRERKEKEKEIRERERREREQRENEKREKEKKEKELAEEKERKERKEKEEKEKEKKKKDPVSPAVKEDSKKTLAVDTARSPEDPKKKKEEAKTPRSSTKPKDKPSFNTSTSSVLDNSSFCRPLTRSSSKIQQPASPPNKSSPSKPPDLARLSTPKSPNRSGSMIKPKPPNRAASAVQLTPKNKNKDAKEPEDMREEKEPTLNRAVSATHTKYSKATPRVADIKPKDPKEREKERQEKEKEKLDRKEKEKSDKHEKPKDGEKVTRVDTDRSRQGSLTGRQDSMPLKKPKKLEKKKTIEQHKTPERVRTAPKIRNTLIAQPQAWDQDEEVPARTIPELKNGGTPAKGKNMVVASNNYVRDNSVKKVKTVKKGTFNKKQKVITREALKKAYQEPVEVLSDNDNDEESSDTPMPLPRSGTEIVDAISQPKPTPAGTEDDESSRGRQTLPSRMGYLKATHSSSAHRKKQDKGLLQLPTRNLDYHAMRSRSKGGISPRGGVTPRGDVKEMLTASPRRNLSKNKKRFFSYSAHQQPRHHLNWTPRGTTGQNLASTGATTPRQPYKPQPLITPVSASSPEATWTSREVLLRLDPVPEQGSPHLPTH